MKLLDAKLDEIGYIAYVAMPILNMNTNKIIKFKTIKIQNHNLLNQTILFKQYPNVYMCRHWFLDSSSCDEYVAGCNIRLNNKTGDDSFMRYLSYRFNLAPYTVENNFRCLQKLCSAYNDPFKKV